MVDPKLAKMLESEYDPNVREIKPVYDPATNQLHYQTDPYVENGEIFVTRIASYPVKVKKAFQVVEEYEMTTNYGDDKG